MTPEEALQKAIEKAGGQSAVARAFKIKQPSVAEWKRCPPHWAIKLERLTGVPREKLRPDLYPRE